jgi:hypothetical protein
VKGIKHEKRKNVKIGKINIKNGPKISSSWSEIFTVLVGNIHVLAGNISRRSPNIFKYWENIHKSGTKMCRETSKITKRRSKIVLWAGKMHTDATA